MNLIVQPPKLLNHIIVICRIKKCWEQQREVFEQTKDHFVSMRYMDEDGSIPPSTFYPEVINAIGSVMLTTHPQEYWEITPEYVPWSEVKGDAKTHFEKIGADLLEQRRYIPKVKPI